MQNRKLAQKGKHKHELQGKDESPRETKRTRADETPLLSDQENNLVDQAEPIITEEEKEPVFSFGFLGLPVELQLLILYHASVVDLLAVSRVNKFLRTLSADSLGKKIKQQLELEEKAQVAMVEATAKTEYRFSDFLECMQTNTCIPPNAFFSYWGLAAKYQHLTALQYMHKQAILDMNNQTIFDRGLNITHLEITALTITAQTGNILMMIFLLQNKKTSFGISTNSEMDVVRHAIQAGHIEIVTLLLNFLMKYHEIQLERYLVYAIECKQNEIFQLLFAHIAHVNREVALAFKSTYLELKLAISKGQVESLKIFKLFPRNLITHPFLFFCQFALRSTHSDEMKIAICNKLISYLEEFIETENQSGFSSEIKDVLEMALRNQRFSIVSWAAQEYKQRYFEFALHDFVVDDPRITMCLVAHSGLDEQSLPNATLGFLVKCQIQAAASQVSDQIFGEQHAQLPIEDIQNLVKYSSKNIGHRYIIVNDYKTTLLGHAVINNELELATLLLQRGAQVNRVLNENDETTLMLAAKNGNIKLVKILLSHGADPSCLNQNQENAFHYAQKAGHKKVMVLLSEAMLKKQHAMRFSIFAEPSQAATSSQADTSSQIGTSPRLFNLSTPSQSTTRTRSIGLINPQPFRQKK